MKDQEIPRLKIQPSMRASRISFNKDLSNTLEEGETNSNGKLLSSMVFQSITNFKISENAKVIKKTYENGCVKFFALGLTELFNKKGVMEAAKMLNGKKFDAISFPVKSYLYESNPERKFIQMVGDQLNIPVIDLFCFPYHPLITKISGVKTQDAIESIMLFEFLKNGTLDRNIIFFLQKAYNIEYFVICENASKMATKIKHNGIKYALVLLNCYEKLMRFAHEMSVKKLRNLNLKGEILVMEDLNMLEVLESITNTTTNVEEDSIGFQNIDFHSKQVTNGYFESANEIFGYKDFMQRLTFYENAINFDNNDRLRVSFMKFLIQYFDFFIGNMEYFRALQVSLTMKDYELDGHEDYADRARKCFILFKKSGKSFVPRERKGKIHNKGAEGTKILKKKKILLK